MEKFPNLFRGRISRKNFVIAYLLILALGFLYFGFMPIEGGEFERYSIAWGYGLIILLIPFIIIGFSLQIRRLHDIGLSWKFMLVMIIPKVLQRLFIISEEINIILNAIVVLYWAILVFKVGENKDNEYGLKPSLDFKLWKAIFNLEK